MPRYVALIRGVNVGGKQKLPMAVFRELLASLGYADVRTHLNSGNAVFRADQHDTDVLAGQIEQAIADAAGLDVRCLVRSRDELQAVIADYPLGDRATEGSKTMAHFLSAAPEPALLAEHDPCTLDPDTIVLGDRVIYQWCPNGVLKAPPVGGFVEKRWRVRVTARNWNTVTKLAALLDD